MSLYQVNGKPTKSKVEEYDEGRYTFYRFQCKDWEMGTKSWGMIYNTEEESTEDDCEILEGKSCCETAKELVSYMSFFGNDFRVLVVEGDCVGEGHDGESVVDISRIVEIWGFNDFIKFMDEIEE
ncbi:hypothetical protein KGF36_18840 [Clostridioides sp. ZZV14-6009]|uniref:hypothetical protein n=1 Tax=unclassified Clostridioides TaxID=2635829 RepID=UPI001D1135A4|nr:hypothetical protein [Clostridioides sp. ZZV14-6009]MCC0743370.1 hypothetical protein [Clostridioides sp. ZZV14-6044]MCC0752707.1 hypothetical protein [Clostridioides sp. ZZV13-5731]